MKKKTPYLDFYKECLKSKQLPTQGLCFSLLDAELDLFAPPGWYNREIGYNEYDEWYWGYNGDKQSGESDNERRFAFTPLRQTIVLFLAAMNNEL